MLNPRQIEQDMRWFIEDEKNRKYRGTAYGPWRQAAKKEYRPGGKAPGFQGQPSGCFPLDGEAARDNFDLQCRSDRSWYGQV